MLTYMSQGVKGSFENIKKNWVQFKSLSKVFGVVFIIYSDFSSLPNLA